MAMVLAGPVRSGRGSTTSLPGPLHRQTGRPAPRSRNIVTTIAQLREVASVYSDFEAYAFDFETMGEHRSDPRRGIPFWISLAGPGRADVIPFGHPLGSITAWDIPMTKDGTRPLKNRKPIPVYADPPDQLASETVFEALEPVMFGAATKIGHNLKFDLEVAGAYYGRVPPAPHFCTQVAAFLINETFLGGFPYSLGSCVKREFKYEYDKSLGRIGVEKFPFSEAANYSWHDSKYDWLLYRRYAAQIEEHGLSDLFALEMRVLRCVVWMETAGVAVDEDGLDQLIIQVRADMDDTYARIKQAAGWDINLNADAQVIRLVFGEYDQHAEKWVGGRGHQPREFTEKREDPSVAGSALTPYLKDPVVSDILHWAELAKLHSTHLLNIKTRLYNGRLHADFDQRGARTGRFSCVAADTLIEMPRDLVEYPHGVPITEIQAGDWVYAYDWHRELVLKRVKWVGQTGVRETVVVTVENSEGHQMTLRLTPDHLVRLRHGDWRPAGSLMHQWGQPYRNDGPRVMTMARRRLDDGYVKFFPHAVAKGNGPTGGGKSREHRWIVEQITGKKVSTKADVHHVDGNRANNHPSNLEKLTIAEHRGKRHIHPTWGEKQPLPDLYCGPIDYRVVSVSPGLVEPVWDMEVEGAHNFIANGVCVHNCRTPNLQNVPVRKQGLVRDLFIAPPGTKLIIADYSQVELRILAHYTKDPLLIKAYEDGLNLHTITAQRAYHVAEPTKEQYSRAKNCNFSMAYGAQASTLVERYGVPNEREAQRLIDAFFGTYTKVDPWRQRVVRRCRASRISRERAAELGCKPTMPYVTTILGRKRHLPDLFSAQYGKRMAAERQAVNTKIQGSAGDINKVAMCQVYDALAGTSSVLMLTIHDELVVQCPDDEAEDIAAIVKDSMENLPLPVPLRVPLVADITIAERWSEK